ncbi:kyphoscoliosis peptidase-like [Mixophyes fleayi]|uniref:kyphoscoliosis peptidase-like n=1 Tax=Mixophyes fleayi TaxID=3061075 RepID=UPI003F4D8977
MMIKVLDKDDYDIKKGLKDEKEAKDLEGSNQGADHRDGAENNVKDKSIKLSFRNKGFQTDDEESNQGKRNRDDDYPWDRSNMKSLTINLKKFEKLDDFASKHETKGTLEQLVKELIHDANTDLEKTRVIWIWICYHIEYDIHGYTNKALRSTDPDVILRTRKGVCGGYASFFQRMCSFAGVQCKEVSGHSKGAGYKVGQKITGGVNHAWNMVYLEGSWHLLDSTWGAGQSDDNVTTFTFQYSEFYFLTHPALFIMDHFPEKSECQLLETCISQQQFEMSVYVRSDFYTLGMVSYQPETAVIETVKGKASIVIESCQNLLFTFHLDEKDTSGVLRLLDNGMMLDVYPQQTGQHVLQIYARRKESEGKYDLIMDYRVNCSFVDTSMKIPKCLNNPVGPSWLSQKAGLLNPSHPDPVIHTDDGCCTISFKTDRDINLYCTLHSDEIQMTKEMERRHIFKAQSKDKVEIKVQLPQSGTYVLQVFIKSGNSKEYTYLCNYLIISTNTSVRWPVFPLTYSNWAKHYDLVQPLEGVLPKNSNVSFRLHIPGVIGVCVDGQSYTPLTLADNGYWEGTCSTVDRKSLSLMIKYINEPNTWHYILNYKIEEN